MSEKRKRQKMEWERLSEDRVKEALQESLHFPGSQLYFAPDVLGNTS